MQAEGIEAIFVVPKANMNYLAGYHTDIEKRLCTAIFPLDGEPAVVAPATQEARVAKGTWIKDIRIWADGEDPAVSAKKVLEERRISKGSIGLDEAMSWGHAHRLQEALPEARFVDCSKILHDLRMTKSTEELEKMKKAAGIVELGIKAGFESTSVGRTELELWSAVAARITSEGGDVTACPWNVHTGANTAGLGLPTGKSKVQRGDLVHFDVAISYEGYFADITRNAVVGPLTGEMKMIQRIVLDAQMSAMKATRPGVTAEAVDRAARDAIAKKCYGPNFGHRLGHGMGLELHEEPSMASGNRIILRPGMVFTNEPGVRLPGKFGFHTEDIVVVTQDGYDLLSTMDREIVQLP